MHSTYLPSSDTALQKVVQLIDRRMCELEEEEAQRRNARGVPPKRGGANLGRTSTKGGTVTYPRSRMIAIEVVSTKASKDWDLQYDYDETCSDTSSSSSSSSSSRPC